MKPFQRQMSAYTLSLRSVCWPKDKAANCQGILVNRNTKPQLYVTGRRFHVLHLEGKMVASMVVQMDGKKACFCVRCIEIINAVFIHFAAEAKIEHNVVG